MPAPVPWPAKGGALAPLQKAASSIDIIECGTVLILAEGLRAVAEIRALFPEKEILADEVMKPGGPASSKKINEHVYTSKEAAKGGGGVGGGGCGCS